jgi:hypothetical protein
LLLRNLELTKIEQAGALWSELRNRIASADFKPHDDQVFLEVVRDTLMGSASIKSWSDAVKSGIVDGTKKSLRHLSAACWRWLMSDAEIGIAVFSLIPDGDQIEAAFIDSIPRQLPEMVGSVVLPICKQKGWLRLHGATLNRTFDLQEAIKRQLAIDTDSGFIDGLVLAVGDALPVDVINAAQKTGDSRLISMASKCVVSMPSALSDADFSLPSVQAIWAGAISKSINSWKAPHDPLGATAIVLDCLIDNKIGYLSIIDEIARTPLADVSSFSRRSLVWDKLAP